MEGKMKKLILIASLATFALGFFAGHWTSTSKAGTVVTTVIAQISPTELMVGIKDLPDTTVLEPF
jgi:vacuolar-type H+-ATPase subunit I/STV1